MCYGIETTKPTLPVQTYEFVARRKLLPRLVFLRQATVDGVKHFSMEGDLTQLVKGCFANLFLLKNDPLKGFAS